MTLADCAVLDQAEIQALIETYISTDAAQVALALAKHPYKILIANQVKYLQRARTKLPSYADARCILLPISYEQSSSEESARRKAQAYTGDTCIDLTLGLGVDSLYFARNFRQVIGIEQDELRAHIAQQNMQRLGVHNLHVLHATAEAFIHAYADAPADLLYCDPARRDTVGNKTLRLEDCTPNVRELLPQMLRCAKRVLLKLSPLFDVAEAWRIHPNISEVAVVSVQGECKELLITIEQELPNTQTLAIHTDTGCWTFPLGESPTPLATTATAKGFVLEPDAAFYKARHTLPLFSRYFQALHAQMGESAEGYFFADTPPAADFPGRVFQLLEAHEYKPQELKKYAKQQQLRALNIAKRHFPLSVAEVRKQLAVAEGGEYALLCTTLSGKKWALLCKPFPLR